MMDYLLVMPEVSSQVKKKVKDRMEYEPCWAGRKAFAGGRWTTPCMRSMLPTHVITDPDTPGAPEILLCTFHYEEVLKLGLVTEPNPTPQRIRAHMEKRRGRS